MEGCRWRRPGCAAVSGRSGVRRGEHAAPPIALARLASVSGRWAVTVALAVYAYNEGGAAYVGILGVVRILPAAIAGPLAASLLDRVRTDRLLLLAGFGRTL